MAKRKLRLIMYIHPWGFSDGDPIKVIFTDKKTYGEVGLYELTKGEGNALQFVAEDYDTSTNMYDALRTGKFLEDMQNPELGQMTMVYVPKGKRLELVDE